MEFNCPQCGKRLRAPDHLKNPLVRCRSCGAAFRPREQAEQPVTAQVIDTPPATPRPQPFSPRPQPVAPRPVSLPPTVPSRTATPRPVTSEAGQTVAKGLGIVVVLIFLLISKAPRLLKGIFPDRQPPPPVQIPDQDLRAIQELLEEARKDPPLQPAPISKPPAKEGQEEDVTNAPDLDPWGEPVQPPK